MTQDGQRDAVIAAARTWLGTPYHHAAQIKGVGVDCITLLNAAYHEAGAIEKIEIPKYVRDWHLHRNAELYLQGLFKYAHEVDAPKKADIVLYKFGRTFSHGAIVVEWPRIIHSFVNIGCVEDNAEINTTLITVGERSLDEGKPREKKFFSIWN